MMKRFVAMLVTLLCMCTFASAQEPATLTAWLEENVPAMTDLFADETLVTTVGQCKVEAPVDKAVVSFLLKTEGATVEEANAKMTAAIETLTQSLAAQGVSEASIQRKAYDVSPNVIYHSSKFTDDRIVDGYIVDMVLCVELADMSLVGKVIDAATQSGADGTHELAFERSWQAEAYQTALNEAAQQAITKAQRLTESCGMALGELVSVVELSGEADDMAKVEVTYRAK